MHVLERPKPTPLLYTIHVIRWTWAMHKQSNAGNGRLPQIFSVDACMAAIEDSSRYGALSIPCTFSVYHRQRALDLQWAKNRQSPHTGDAQHKTCPMQRTGAGTVFGFHTVPSCYLCIACLIGVLPLQSLPISLCTTHVCFQGSRRAGAKCEALAGPMSILKSLPSPTHFETRVASRSRPLPALITAARSGGHPHALHNLYMHIIEQWTLD